MANLETEIRVEQTITFLLTQFNTKILFDMSIGKTYVKSELLEELKEFLESGKNIHIEAMEKQFEQEFSGEKEAFSYKFAIRKLKGVIKLFDTQIAEILELYSK